MLVVISGGAVAVASVYIAEHVPANIAAALALLGEILTEVPAVVMS